MPIESLPAAGAQALWLKEEEEALVRAVTASLDAGNAAEAEIIRQRFECLKSFGASVALFPPIQEAQSLRGHVRDAKRLVQFLVGLAPSSYLLHIPARILAVRSFLVTKFHAFSLLSKFAPPSSEWREPVHAVLFSVLFTIMAEDVYFSCLDEMSFPVDMKAAMAGDLVSFWDTGSELAMAEHFPALEALWSARNNSPPSFGTLDGNSEIFRISIDLGEDWHDFLVSQLADDETKWALEEFLFGLSFEELASIRTRLRRFGIHAADFDEIRMYLGSIPAYSVEKNDDPRALYDFYIDRKEASQIRRRLGAPGPYKTLEEIYLKYRMNFWT